MEKLPKYFKFEIFLIYLLSKLCGLATFTFSYKSWKFVETSRTSFFAILLGNFILIFLLLKGLVKSNTAFPGTLQKLMNNLEYFYSTAGILNTYYIYYRRKKDIGTVIKEMLGLWKILKLKFSDSHLYPDSYYLAYCKFQFYIIFIQILSVIVSVVAAFWIFDSILLIVVPAYWLKVYAISLTLVCFNYNGALLIELKFFRLINYQIRKIIQKTIKIKITKNTGQNQQYFLNNLHNELEEICIIYCRTTYLMRKTFEILSIPIVLCLFGNFSDNVVCVSTASNLNFYFRTKSTDNPLNKSSHKRKRTQKKA